MNNISTQALRLHRQCILIDGHNDHLMLKYKRQGRYDFARVCRKYHSDAPRLIKGGMTAAMFMVNGHVLEGSMAMMELAHREIEAHPEMLTLVTRVADIRKAKHSGKLGIIFSWESCTALQNNLDILPLAYRLGMRVSTVTHGEGGSRFALQGSRSPFRYCTAGDRNRLRTQAKGLTPFGKKVVRTMNDLGILVDVAHANDRTVEDLLRITNKPVVSTHGGVFACSPHSRCSTDDQIKAIAATGGLQSIAFYDDFIAKRPKKATVDGIVDQIAYIADLVGIDHVGIGTDFDGLSEGEWPIIRTADRLPELTEAMLRRGFHASEIKKVWGGNYLRVLKATIG